MVADAERLAREALANCKEGGRGPGRGGHPTGLNQQQMVISCRATSTIQVQGGGLRERPDPAYAQQDPNATRKINQRPANIDPAGTVSLLERMKEKVNGSKPRPRRTGDGRYHHTRTRRSTRP